MFKFNEEIREIINNYGIKLDSCWIEVDDCLIIELLDLESEEVYEVEILEIENRLFENENEEFVEVNENNEIVKVYIRFISESELIELDK